MKNNNSDLENHLFFITGLPRSGTTLISSVLSSSEEIKVTTEIWFFNYWKEKYSFLDLSNRKDLEFFLNKFFNSKRFSYLNIEKERIINAIIEDENKWNFNSIFEEIIYEFKKENNTLYVGEKTPGQYKVLHELLSFNKASKIICVVRDPRAIAASIMKVPFGSNRVLVTARMWNFYTNSLKLIQNDPRVFIVKYEDLVLNTEDTITRVNSFLGRKKLDYKFNNDRKKNFPGTKSRNGWSKGHFEKANSSIETTSLDKWKQFLTKNQIKTINKITKENRKIFGYYDSEELKSEPGLAFVLKEGGLLMLSKVFKLPSGLINSYAGKTFMYKTFQSIFERH